MDPAEVAARAQAQARARAALDVALGVVAPDALALADGRVRLTNSRGDVLSREAMERLDTRLSEPSSQQLADERLLAEAVALLGAEIDQARGGNSPVDGATVALDRLLDVPELPAHTQAEAQTMLRGVLEGNELTTASAARRLATERAAERAQQRPPLVATTRLAAAEIEREAQVLTHLNRTAATPVRRRHRKVVGGKHRAKGQHAVGTPAAAGLIAGGRAATEQNLTEPEALAGLLRVQPGDISGGLVAPMQVVGRPQVGVVTTANHGAQHFRVQVAEPPKGLLAQTTLRAGSISDPHVIQLSPRLADAQLARVWTNQVSRTLLKVEARDAAPKNVLGRFGPAFDNFRGRGDATTAQYDEWRMLSRNWREEQLKPTPDVQRTAEIEQDLHGLSAALQKKRQPVPAFPWTPEARHVVAPEPTAPQVAANTPAHLRGQVVAQLEGLQKAAADLEERAGARRTSATAATELATKTIVKAETEEGRKDAAAPERGRKLRVAADLATVKAGRHTVIAESCEAAAKQANESGEAYQALLTRLDELEASGEQPGPDVAALAQTAGERVTAYSEGVKATLPSPDVLQTALTSGRLPHLTALTEELNKPLIAQGNPNLFTPEVLHRRLRAETRGLLSPDGVVLTVGNDARANVSELTQFKLRLQPGELREVLDSPVDFDEGQLGQIDQGGYNVSTTATETVGYSGGASLKTATAVLPDSSALKAVSHIVSPGLEFAVGQSHSVSGTATEYGLGGGVEVLNGEILRYRSDTPSWSLQMRTSAVGEWSEPRVVDTGELHDNDRLEIGIGHSYTVPPPKDTVRLDTSGVTDKREERLPEYVVSRVDGLNDLSDKAVAGLRARLGGLDRVGHDQIRGLVMEDGPSRLDEATRPGGIGRLITHQGRPVAYAQLETTVVMESAELLSDSSAEHKIERLRVGFSGASGSQSFGSSGSFSANVGYPGTATQDLGSSQWDFGPNVKAGRSVSRKDSLSTSDVAIHPSVQRTEQTVGMKVRLVHKLTIHKIDKDESFPVEGEGDAVLRLPENDAFRYGLPVPEKALVRGPDGQPQTGMDGRVLLRGDAQPTTEKIGLPTSMGSGPGQLRGAGPALVQDFKGADPAFKAFVRHLSDEGMVPPLDAKLRPRMSELVGKDPALVASQLKNLERVGQHLSRHRLETGYDQAAQGGIVFALTKHHTGRPPQERSFRIDLTQHTKRHRLLGINESQTATNLHIGSNTTVRSRGRSKGLPWSAKFGFSNKPGQGHAGSTPDVGPSYGRSALGRYFGWATGSTVNGVTLTESTAPLADFEVPHTITVREIHAGRDSDPIVEVEGSARLTLDSEFCDRGEEQGMAIAGRVNPALLQTATWQHLDTGNALNRLTAALPAAARADSAALHHLAAFMSVRNLSAHREMLTSEYATRFAVSGSPSNLTEAMAQRGLAPRQASVSLRARVENLRYVGSGHQVIGDINLTLGSSSFTASSSTGNTAGIGGGSGMAEADGDGWNGSAGLSRSGSRSSSSTQTAINGVERLNIKDGQHYQFVGDLILDAEIRAAGLAEPEKAELDNGAILMTMPERDALKLYGQKKLDLPLSKVTDATERLLDGNLSLDRSTTVMMLRRYQAEKVGATGELAVSHTDERLMAKLRETAALDKPASTPAKFDQVAADAETVAASRTEITTHQHYDTTMGAAVVDQHEFVDSDGNETDPHREVLAAIGERVPDALQDPAVTAALRSELADLRYRGHMDELLDPAGFTMDYPFASQPLNAPGTPAVATARNLRVRARLVYEGPPTIDADPDAAAKVGAKATPEPTPDGQEPDEKKQTENAFNIIQGYDYIEEGRSATTTVGYSGNLGGDLTDAGTGSLGLNTELTTSTTGTSVSQNTAMSRALWEDTTRVQRKVRLIIDVDELPAEGDATKGIVQRATDRLRNQEKNKQPPHRREATGTLTLLVPTADINPPPVPDIARDHRPVTLPNTYLLRGIELLQDGERIDVQKSLEDEELKDQDVLVKSACTGLADRKFLTAAGVELHKPSIRKQLSAASRRAVFERSDGGAGSPWTPPLPVPGHGSRAVSMRIRAEVSGLRLLHDPDKRFQQGKIAREQDQTQTATESTEVLPTSRTIGGKEANSDIKVGMSTGDQVTAKDSDSAGNRDETSVAESGNEVVVEVLVEFHVDVRRMKFDRHNQPKVDQEKSIPQAATGIATLSMFRHEFQEIQARQEAGLPPFDGWDPARLAAATKKSREVRVTGHELITDDQGREVHQPYRPMVEALAQARKEGVVVALTMHRENGDQETYRAMPNGTMTGRTNSAQDGFARAFATLHPQLALLSEGTVDLRDLYAKGNHNGRFSGTVVKALEDKGIPASTLTDLDHSRPGRQTTGAQAGDGAKQPIGRAATAKTGSGLAVQ